MEIKALAGVPARSCHLRGRRQCLRGHYRDIFPGTFGRRLRHGDRVDLRHAHRPALRRYQGATELILVLAPLPSGLKKLPEICDHGTACGIKHKELPHVSLPSSDTADPSHFHFPFPP